MPLRPVSIRHLNWPRQKTIAKDITCAAGIPIEQVVGSKTSVYVGSTGVEYDKFFDMDEEIQPQYKATGTGGTLLPNRLSWFFDFRGPSIAIDTACSSSMIALHLACQSIRSKESTMV